MDKLLASLKSLGPLRLAALGALGIGVLGLFLLLTLRGSAPQMALLYGDLELRDSAQVVSHLERLRVPHEIRGNGAQIFVPANQVPRLRLSLAHEGLPAGGSTGYEIFDRGQGLTATQFEQGLNHVRAMEGELARTIRTIQGVRAVRVHLVLPRREPFARDRQEAQASILLTMAGAQRMDQEQVQAVVNLVAAAVPGLKPQHISIVDGRGSLLARGGQAVGQGVGGLPPHEELRRATEIRLARAVEEMLERGLGHGKARAEATVEMDLDRLNETQERFDPDGQVARSQQSTTERSSSREAQQGVSVQNNLPNPEGNGTNTAGSQEQRQEETTNYEISRTVRVLVREQPSIKRVSMAVLVDGIVERGPDGQPAWRERSPDELARIATLVRSAVGFDERRGDRVEIVQMRFAGAEEPGTGPAEAGPTLLDRMDPTRLAEVSIYALACLLVLLLVVRPVAQGLVGRLPPQAVPLPRPRAGEVETGAAAALPGAGATASPAALQAPEVQQPEVEMLSVANIEGQMRASSAHRVSGLVRSNPQAALSVLREWMAAGSATV